MLRIKEVAKIRGVSLTEIATQLGISKVSLSYTLKNGNPTLETLSKIANVLGVDVRDLIEPTKESSEEVLYKKNPDGSFTEFVTVRYNNPTANDNTQTATE